MVGRSNPKFASMDPNEHREIEVKGSHASHYSNAAFHHGSAAHHHRQAARHHESGNVKEADRHTGVAHSHS